MRSCNGRYEILRSNGIAKQNSAISLVKVARQVTWAGPHGTKKGFDKTVFCMAMPASRRIMTVTNTDRVLRCG